jgi:hypothetical protein
VEASRMRGRLAKFYAEEGKHDAIVISVPNPCDAMRRPTGIFFY